MKEGEDSDNTNMNPPQELQSTDKKCTDEWVRRSKGKDSNITVDCVCILRLANLLPERFTK